MYTVYVFLNLLHFDEKEHYLSLCMPCFGAWHLLLCWY